MSSSLDAILGLGDASTATATGTASSSSSPAQSQFITTLFNQLVQTTRQANALPDVDDYKYLASTSPEFVTQSNAVQSQLLNILGLISDAITVKGESSLARNKRGNNAVATSTTYSGKKDTLDRFHQLSDTVDTALEAVDLCLDEHRGVKRGNTAMVSGDVSGRLPRGNNQFSSSSTMLKPQRLFAHLIDNSARTWIPIIKSKPNALKPLLNYEKLRKEREEKSGSSSANNQSDNMDEDEDDTTAPVVKGTPSPKLSAAMTSHIASLGMSTELKSPAASIYPHPYKYEIENIDYAALRSKQLVQCKEQLYEPLTKVPCTWVDSVELLQELAEELESVSEIAIDLEHHSFRSYFGFTCLMQISTRKADYLIDTLALRTELWRLNTSFTDPAIVKVLHGADSDIIWLQRDFGLYIVNLFDTGQAARVLEFQSFGLAYLLKHFCDVHTDKKYQLADWRIRPLSAEMLLYARMDTHYLLYIYDRLKNDLITRSTAAQNQLSPIQGVAYQLATVLERSKAISLKTYEKEDVNSVNAPMEFAFKMGVILQNDVQSKVLMSLFKLRDDLARKEDESVFYMCSNQNLMQIIQNMPVDQQQLEAVCNKPIPPLVRNHAQQVLATIAEAKTKNTLTSPFLASTLPATTASPLLAGSSGDAHNIDAMTVGHGAIHTPQKYNKTLFGAQNASSSSGLPPINNMTPATATSALFSQLSHSTPQHHSNVGWVAQALHDAAPMHQPSQQSPVMSTDQLYSSANWIQASKNLERSLSSVKNPPSLTASLGSGVAIPLFDESESLGQPHSSPQRSSFQALPSPPPKSSPFAILATSMESKDAEANRAALAQAHAALTTAPTYTHAISALSAVAATPLKSNPSPTDSTQMDMDDDSSMLRTPNTGEPVHSFVSPSPMSLQVIPSPLTVPSTTGFTSIAGDVPAATDATLKASSSSPLPKSMREIYKISNENRRKKKKVKTNSGAGMAANSGMDGDDDEAGSASASAHNSRPSSSVGMRKDGAGGKKGQANSSDSGPDGTSSQEFMKSIGWGSGATPPNTSNAAMQLLNNQPNSANPSVNNHDTGTYHLHRSSVSVPDS